jgi:hypothetical protein
MQWSSNPTQVIIDKQQPSNVKKKTQSKKPNTTTVQPTFTTIQQPSVKTDEL